VICLVDTPGAFCGLEAEERGQGEAIAKNLYTLAGLTVPVLSVVIGEGGSGGALALAGGGGGWVGGTAYRLCFRNHMLDHPHLVKVCSCELHH